MDRRALLGLLAWPLAAQASEEWAGLSARSRATMRFFGLRVYDAQVWSAAPLSVEGWAQQAFALSLSYHRSLQGDEIAKRSLVEMRRQGPIPESDAARWLAEMQAAFPDVNEGDRITGRQKLSDRFAILDVPDSDTTAAAFRTGIRAETDFLKYGAAYVPFLNTSIPFEYTEATVEVGTAAESGSNTPPVNSFSLTLPTPASTTNALLVKYTGTETAPAVEIRLDAASGVNVDFSVSSAKLTITIKSAPTTGSDISAAWAVVSNKLGFDLELKGTGGNIAAKESTPLTKLTDNTSNTGKSATQKLGELNKGNNTGQTAVYNQVKQALAAQRVTLPPSPAIAGVYARVDRIRGVWKSPGNVSVVGISGPARLITSGQQDDLNVDANSGKSINVIRSFTGKGTLVWGARTLAGNDNEWRYVSVRRLFNLIEESVQKSTAFAVFEPNDAGTWLKVKAMIDSYLYNLWQQGALAGSVPEQAYFVHVGLGKTMTAQDILEGRMYVEVGIAAVRPAEFIILRFSHKLQEA